MLPAEITGKYQELRTLGAGAMGTVVEALDTRIERRVAIKVVKRPPADDAEAQEAHARFRREAQAAGRLAHPSIVAVYDYGENAESAWIVMELVEGGSLKDRFDRQERFLLPEALRVMDQVLGALAFSHARGVVHRDIKPANIMLTADGQVKIADFGIARLENSAMTQVGTLIGTPSYMAPEQLRGEPVDARADLWAAGVVLYQLLTGEKPFDGGFSAVMHKALHTDPVPPSQLSQSCPAALDAVVRKALAKRPAERFAKAEDFAAALKLAASGQAPGPDAEATMVAGAMAAPAPAAAPAPPPTPPPAKGGKGGLVLGLAGAALAAGIAAFFLLAPGQPPAEAPVAASQASPAPAAPAQQAAAIPASAAVEPPAAPPPPPPDLRAAALALAVLPCGILRAEVSEGLLIVNGPLQRSQVPALRAALAANRVPDSMARLRVQLFDGPYCGLLELVRPLPPEAAPRLSLPGPVPLQKGELLRFDVAMPERTGQLHLAYLMSTGEVARLAQARPEQAGTRFRVGDPRPGFEGWAVEEPFGTDMLVAILSERPLLPAGRPAVERLEDWLRALQAAVQDARATGQRVGIQVLPVETVAVR